MTAERLMWKGVWIENVPDEELAIARDYSHRRFHQLNDAVHYAPFSNFEFVDGAIQQLCAVEAECIRRGQDYRDPFVWRLF